MAQQSTFMADAPGRSAITATLLVGTASVGLGQVASAAGPAPAATVISNGWTTSAPRPPRGCGVDGHASGSGSPRRRRAPGSSMSRSSTRPVARSSSTSTSRPSLPATRRTFTVSWPVPAGQAPGSYTVKIGIFGAGWTRVCCTGTTRPRRSNVAAAASDDDRRRTTTAAADHDHGCTTTTTARRRPRLPTTTMRATTRPCADDDDARRRRRSPTTVADAALRHPAGRRHAAVRRHVRGSGPSRR